ncbi:Trypsin [Streptomyces sp. SceaMP-e96]|uniref:trypsin-like serine protease n=1 Tax=Streptomyces TaxID=1883 RepID=UPI00082395B4|nr:MULTISPECIES: trypsin-like serine protease [unclassified Streptomyces]MYT17789.1 trypsin-like serine protease [Streptomyces sp. SID4951]SCK46889.1 Trypsin [Streptomyces sp. SceaMP-e96]
MAPEFLGGVDAQTVLSSVVHIGADTGYIFSGALLSPDWVLTVKRCLEDVPGYSVHRGDGNRVRVDQQHGAPVGDMALLHLDSPLDGAKIWGAHGDGYVPLASSTDQPPAAGDTVYVMGYGSDGLEVAEEKITSYGPDGSYGMAGSASSHGGASFVGDSGGPVFGSQGKAGLVLIGVVSGGTVWPEGDWSTWFAGGPTVWSVDGTGTMNRDWIHDVTGI